MSIPSVVLVADCTVFTRIEHVLRIASIAGKMKTVNLVSGRVCETVECVLLRLVPIWHQ